jgi:hypothetical protein
MLIIMIAARISENVRYKILTVALLGIQVFWDSPEFLECLKLMAVCSFKMPRTTSQ